MKKRLCFVIPYFGKLPNYFPLFLKSCEANPKFNWIVFTDDDGNYDYPDNVLKVKMTFKECQTLVKSKFEFHVALEKPYKLCDLKPMYGYIFEEYLKEFNFWGHCDVDTIMGNLDKWLSEEFLERYDKLFCLGHMTIYRNSFANNRVFMHRLKDKLSYKDVLSNERIMWFDEEWNNDYNINRIFLDTGKKVFKEDLSLNISYSYNNFVRGKYVGKDNTTMPFGFEIEQMKKAIYIWDQGNLFRIYSEKGKLKKEHFLYMHLQNRPMKMNFSLLYVDRFEIIPDEFIPCRENTITNDNIDGLCICKSWLVQKLFCQRLIRRIKSFFV